MSKSRRDIERLVEALGDVPIDDAAVKETVERLGVDVKELANKARALVAAAAKARALEARAADAKRARDAEIAKLERRRQPTKRSHDEQLVIYRALLARVPADALAMHFHKFTTTTDEDLADAIRILRHVLGEDEPE